MAAFEFSGEVVWRPDPQLVAQSNLQQFMLRHGQESLEALHQRSISDLSWFWDAVLQDLDIRFVEPYAKVVELSRGMPWAQWCAGSRLNIVQSCLDKHSGTPTDQRLALRWEGEAGAIRTLTYAELRRDVNRAANALRGLGLGRGDVIGVLMPMTPEIVVAMLAIIKIGGIFLPLFSGFGAPAVATRLADAEAKALFTADGCLRRGKIVELKSVADEAVAQVPSLRHVIVLKHIGADIPWTSARDRWWHDWINQGREESLIEPMPAEEPLMLIYTSGTTGRAKGAVHTHCGFPVKAAQDMKQGLDLHADETLFWVTDMGWMMGPWLVFGTLLLGATMMLYDGAPDWPGPERLWSMVERHRITTLGLSPTLVRALRRHGDEPVRKHELSSLRKFASTGEPWNPDPWLWLFHSVGRGRLPILNYSGGTEISGGIVMSNVLTPLKPCSFSGPLPGMAAAVVDEEGRPVREQVGELVIRQPWLGMTRGFWRDPQRYLDTYWSRWPDTWVHGDWAAIDSDGLWYILGRSDDTIKIAGKRLGPAEVESILVSHPDVSEAAAIGVPDELKGEALVCFCVLKRDSPGNEPLRQALKELVGREMGRPLAPREVKFVRELPKTRNAKVMRRVLRATFLGQDPGDLLALENPSSVAEIRRAT
jgi:acetyl-CoA synthetase